jgi:glycosyltransferase involved in cell wall biosynthesis
MSDTPRRPVRLGLVAPLPVHYQAPLYRALAADRRLEFTAIFGSREGAGAHLGGYGRPIDFAVDVLAGYRSVFLPGSERVRVIPAGKTEPSPLALRHPAVVAEIRRWDFEVLWLHGYNFVMHWLAIAAQRARRGAVYIREEQTLLHPRPPLKRMVKGIGLRLLFTQCGGLHIGTNNRRWFEHYGLPPDRLFFTPYVVENARLREIARDLAPRKSELQDELGVAGQGPVIVTVSRLIPKKDPFTLLRAFARVRALNRCALLVVGTGELEEELRRHVAEAGIPDVTFAGFLSQMHVPRAYAAADIFALASRIHETWGIVVNEAMNFELPVVVTDKVGSAADLVDGSNGFVVPAGDEAALAARLLELVESAELRTSFGRQSLELIDRWGAYERTAAGIVDAVQAAVGPTRWQEACGT